MPELDEQQERARATREALVGKSIAGRYVLRALVGHGGMGAVYEAEHLGLGKRVAIKFIDSEFATDERVVARFAREARAMSAIESAHIVTVFDAGTEDGRPYLVMELLRGEDLGQRLRRMRRIPVDEAMHIVAQVLKGLAKAHAAGIVHRDLKPDNIFLVKGDTDPLFAKIVDFGISKIERPRDKTSPLALTGRGTVLGTPFYMCPEQAQAASDVDARADIYSVGAILFECLTGRPPHTGETYEQIILSICMRDAPDLRAIDPSLPPEVASFVGRALARDRTDRYGSSERMLAALHDIAPDEKKRVPLETGAPETLASPGVLFPKGPPSSRVPLSQRAAGGAPGAATQLVGSLQPAGGGGGGSSDAAPNSAVAPATIVDPPPPASGVGTGFRPSSPQQPAAAAAARPSANNQPAARPAGAAAASLAHSGMGDSAMLSAIGIPSARRKRSMTTIVVTALIATLLGVGVMLGVIVMLNKKNGDAGAALAASGSSARTTMPPTITSGGVPGAPTTSSGGATTTTPNVNVAASTSAPAPAASTSGATTGNNGKPGPAPTTGPGPRPSGGKPGGKLDISRDFPQ